MNRQPSSLFKCKARGLLCLLLAFTGLAILAPAMQADSSSSPVSESHPLLDLRYRIGPLIHSDDFLNGLGNWTSELENGGTVEAKERSLLVNVPAGATVWFKPLLEGPLLIEYEAIAIENGGPNDRVSDLNCFWMARDARGPEKIFDTKRSGKFADYNQLRTYYVGLGGNANTTTRFRRYIGDAVNRPLLPEHDLSQPCTLLVPNVTQTIRLVAYGPIVQYYRDGRRLFDFKDPEPYTSGWFGFRTVTSHFVIKHFRVYRLLPPSL